MQNAEYEILKTVQKQEFHKEVSVLKYLRKSEESSNRANAIHRNKAITKKALFISLLLSLMSMVCSELAEVPDAPASHMISGNQSFFLERDT